MNRLTDCSSTVPVGSFSQFHPTDVWPLPGMGILLMGVLARQLSLGGTQITNENSPYHPFSFQVIVISVPTQGDMDQEENGSVLMTKHTCLKDNCCLCFALSPRCAPM